MKLGAEGGEMTPIVEKERNVRESVVKRRHRV